MQTTRCSGVPPGAAGLACLLLLTASALGGGPEPMQVNRGLKILYAGRAGSEREKDFVGFLKKYFDVVQTGNLKTFKEADTQGFDVMLLDWDWDSWPTLKISDRFSRPVVTLGSFGALLCGNWRLKTAHW